MRCRVARPRRVSGRRVAERTRSGRGHGWSPSPAPPGPLPFSGAGPTARGPLPSRETAPGPPGHRHTPSRGYRSDSARNPDTALRRRSSPACTPGPSLLAVIQRMADVDVGLVSPAGSIARDWIAGSRAASMSRRGLVRRLASTSALAMGISGERRPQGLPQQAIDRVVEREDGGRARSRPRPRRPSLPRSSLRSGGRRGLSHRPPSRSAQHPAAARPIAARVKATSDPTGHERHHQDSFHELGDSRRDARRCPPHLGRRPSRSGSSRRPGPAARAAGGLGRPDLARGRCDNFLVPAQPRRRRLRALTSRPRIVPSETWSRRAAAW